MDASPQPQTTRHVSIAELFMGFLMIGLQGFGGIAVAAHHQIVERRRWLDPKEFVEMFGICSILPGGNFMNATIMIGARYQGAAGSVVAMCGLLLMPLLILITVAATYDHFSYLPDVRAATAGAASAAAGLILSTGAKLGRGVVWTIGPILAAVATFVVVGVIRAPLWSVVVTIVPLSVALQLVGGKRR